MEIISYLLGFLAMTAPLQSVSADNPIVTGDTHLTEELISYNFSSISLYDDCNNNPEQYNKYHHKLVPYRCDTCVHEIWSLNGISMTPTLKDGSLLKMAMNGFSNLTEGMIVIYDPRKDMMGSPLDMDIAKKYDFNVMYRIVGVQGYNYVIKGDANNLCELIPKNEIKSVLMELDF